MSSVGTPVSGQLAANHPYRTLIEETLATRRSRGPVQMGDDQLAMAHAIAGPNNELVGILLVVRNLAYVSRMQSTIAYSRKLVALGRLTAGIAHEVKNPLPVPEPVAATPNPNVKVQTKPSAPKPETPVNQPAIAPPAAPDAPVVRAARCGRGDRRRRPDCTSDQRPRKARGLPETERRGQGAVQPIQALQR